jgi:hypothetical protein
MTGGSCGDNVQVTESVEPHQWTMLLGLSPHPIHGAIGPVLSVVWLKQRETQAQLKR